MVQCIAVLPVFFWLFLSHLTKLENNRLPAAVIMCHRPIQALIPQHDTHPTPDTHTYKHTPHPIVCYEPEASLGFQSPCITLSLLLPHYQNK